MSRTLEEKTRIVVERCNSKWAHTLCGMIKPFYMESDEEAMSVTLGYPCMEWQQNPNGVLHGGMVATLIDTTIGIASIAVIEKLTPTINLQVSYLRPCPADGTLAVRAYITMLGGSVVHTRAELWDTREPDRLIATAEGAYRRFKNAPSDPELI